MCAQKGKASHFPLGLDGTGNFYLQLLQQGDCVIIAIIAMSGKRNKLCYQSEDYLVHCYGPTISK